MGDEDLQGDHGVKRSVLHLSIWRRRLIVSPRRSATESWPPPSMRRRAAAAAAAAASGTSARRLGRGPSMTRGMRQASRRGGWVSQGGVQMSSRRCPDSPSHCQVGQLCSAGMREMRFCRSACTSMIRMAAHLKCGKIENRHKSIHRAIAEQSNTQNRRLGSNACSEAARIVQAERI